MMTAGLSLRRSLPGRSGRWALTFISLICPWCHVTPLGVALGQACCHAIVLAVVSCCWQPESNIPTTRQPCHEAPKASACQALDHDWGT